MSRALAYLTDRLIWPYCLPAKAEQCLELHERIESTHSVYQHYAEANAANFILSDLHDNLARLLGNSLLNERDHTPMEKDLNWRDTGEIVSVQDWLATAGMTQPLAQVRARRLHLVQGGRGGNGPAQPGGAPRTA